MDSSSEIFKNIVENSKSFIFILNENGIIEYANKYALDFFGFKKDELTGKSALGTVIPEKELLGRDLKIMLNNIVDNPDEYTVNVNENVKKTGERVWVSWSNSYYKDEETGKKKIICIGNDITAKLKSKNSNEKIINDITYYKLINSVEQGVIVTNLNGEIIYWNKFAEKMYGWKSDEVIGKQILEVTPTKISKKQAEEIMQKLGKGENYSGEFLVEDKKGKEFPILITNSPVFNDNGELTAIIGVSKDITDIKEKEKQILKGKDTFKSLIDAFNDLAMLLDADGNLITGNKALEKLLNKTVSEVVGTNILKLLPDEIGKIKEDSLNKVIKTKKPFSYIDKSRENLIFDSMLFPILNISGEVEQIAVFAYDITDKYRYQQNLEEERQQLLSIFNSIPAAIYISDMKTHEIIFVNKFLEDIIGDEKVVGEKCYKALQGLSEPCSFCTNDIIKTNENDPHIWEYHNPKLNTDALICDRLIKWPDGRDVRFEMSILITEQKRRERELFYRISFEELLLRISNSFIKARHFELNTLINDAIKEIGEFVNADRCYIFIVYEEKGYMKNTFEWCSEGIIPQIDSLQKVSFDELPWLYSRIKKREIVEVDDLTALPKEADNFKMHLDKQNIKSLIAVPLFYEGKITGMLGFDSVQKKRKWSEDDKTLLTLIGQNIINAIKREEITERLQKSEEELRNLFENNINPIIVIDGNGDYLDANKAALEFLNCSLEELKKKNVTDYIPPEDNADEIVMQHADLWSKGGIVETRYCIDGEIKILNLLISPIEQKDRDIILGIGTDITEQKKFEKKLEDSYKEIQYLKDFYKMILENTTDAVWVADKNDVIEYANNAMSEIAGISEEDLVGISVFEDFPDETTKSLKEYYLRAINKLKPVRYEEILVITPDKRKSFQSGWIIPLIVDNGYNGMICTVEDVTEKKKAQDERIELINKLEKALNNEKMINEELEASYEEMETVQDELEIANIKLEKALNKSREANFYKTEFLANMSHEIRTPLTAILGFNQLMMSDDNLTDEQLENMNLIHKSGKRLMNLLMDILVISQIETGKIKIEKEEVNIDKITKEIKDVFALKIKEKNIYLKINTDDVKSIVTDSKRLGQILLNLIGNAIKFTNKGGITLEIKNENNFFLFLVKDTGIGIKDSVQEKIFESFVIGEEGYTKKYQGVGLGLTICKRLVELLGGDIWVESKSGKGTTFYFTLPVKNKNEIEKENIKDDDIEINADILSKKSANIAVVDDEKTSLNFVKDLLNKKTNYNVITYMTCQNLINDILKKCKFDLILLDVRMPEINGIDCLEKVKSICKNITIIALTAFAMPDDKKKLINAGFDDYISKPIDINKFLRKLNTYLK